MYSHPTLYSFRVPLCYYCTINSSTPMYRQTYKLNFTIEEAYEIGIALGINWNISEFTVHQFHIGLNVELEHGKRNAETNITDDDPILTGKLVLLHLKKLPDYYIRLKKMEEKAKVDWDMKEV